MRRIRTIFPKGLTALWFWLSIFCFLSNIAHAEWSEWIADAEVSYSTNDNINNSFFGQEERNEQIWNAFLSVGRIYQLTDRTRLQLAAQTGGGIHDDFSGLNQFDVGASLAIRHKFGLGAYQPWIRGSVTSNHIFSNSTIRNGQLTTAGVQLGKRLHDRFDVVVHYTFDYRIGQEDNALDREKLIARLNEDDKSNSVFDLNGHSIGAEFNFLVTEKFLVSLGYTYRDGDVVSSNDPAFFGSVPGLDPRARLVDAVATDDAFERDPGSPVWAWRTDADTQTYSVDANYALFGGHASLNFGYQRVKANARRFDYANDIFRVNLIYGF